MAARSNYQIHDRATGIASELRRAWGPMNPRFFIIDRRTGKVVDEASTRYEARQAVTMLTVLEAEGAQS